MDLIKLQTVIINQIRFNTFFNLEGVLYLGAYNRIYFLFTSRWACNWWELYKMTVYSILFNLSQSHCLFKNIIIQCKLFFLFIGRESTMWPANNCVIIMICSCAMSSTCVWRQIISCSGVNETALFSFLQIALAWKWQIAFQIIKTNSVIKIEQLLILVITKYWDFSVSHRSIICQPLALANNWSACHWQITIFC